jgi:methylmalonyl-CoA carboxyltransferase small subunit
MPAAPPPLPRAAASDSNVAEDKVCRSPVAGVVVRVNAQAGQQIQANDPLLVLEAMKMETNITSPVAGKIKAINAGVGDGVQMGQVLVEFE